MKLVVQKNHLGVKFCTEVLTVKKRRPTNNLPITTLDIHVTFSDDKPEMNRLLNAASRIAVVGSGPSGLCCAHRFKESGFNVKIFEAADKLGGTWRYSTDPSTDTCSSMYQNLRTNLPIKCMAFPDFPFPETEGAFPSHTVILKYLNDYANEVYFIIFLSWF